MVCRSSFRPIGTGNPPAYPGPVAAGALSTAWREPAIPWTGPPPTADVALVAVLVPATIAEGLLRDDVPWPAFSIAAALVVVVALLWRRAHPLATTIVAFGAQTAAGVLPDLAGREYGVLYTTSVFLLFPYSLGRWASGRGAIAGMGVVLAAHGLREPLYGESVTDILVGAGFLLFPAALGAAVRFAVTSRDRQADQIRSREREQLARELHDTVAHHVSGIVIQAQAGRAVAATDPARAVEVLGVIEGAATRSLEEMRTIVALLRSDEAAERAPVPGVRDLAQLARGLATRLEVQLEVQDDLDLDPALDAAVYRLVQESVTNAQRHATGASSVRVEVSATSDAVSVSVRDDGRPVAGRRRSDGFGLTGMAERVDLLGGDLEAGPAADGGWAVVANLPMSNPRRRELA